MAKTFEIPILVSSDTQAGAFNVDPNNSKFDVSFPNEIKIPGNASNITIEVVNATIWNTAYNISAALGNNVFTLDVQGDAVYTVTIPDGLYDLLSLSDAINVSLTNQGLADGLISLQGDSATQRVVVKFATANLQLDFTVPNSCNEVLGFNARKVPLIYTTAARSEYGDVSARFNNVNYFLVHSDIVLGGIPVNGKQTSVVARVLIDSPPGTQILFDPRNPVRIPAQHLAGSTISRLHFWLTSEDGISAPDFNGELFSVLVVIRYQL